MSKIRISKTLLTELARPYLLSIPFYKELSTNEFNKELKEFVEGRLKQIKFMNDNGRLEGKCFNGCCSLAHMVPCVCVKSYFCPVHGDCHIGSHD